MSWNQSSYASADVRDVRVTAFLSKVYGWMFLGLLITAGTALAVASSPLLIETLIGNRILFWILLIAQLGLVFYLSARVDKMAPATAAGRWSGRAGRSPGRSAATGRRGSSRRRASQPREACCSGPRARTS